MNFSVEEENLICMYHTSDRRRTIARMLAALPDMDTEMRLLANGTIAKLERMTDTDFDGQRFDFASERYCQLDNNTSFSTKVMCRCQHRNSRTRWPYGYCVRLFLAYAGNAPEFFNKVTCVTKSLIIRFFTSAHVIV